MNHKEQYTVIPLRDVVVFPYMIVPIFVGRPRSVKALNIANSTDKKLFLTLQKEAVTDNPQIEDLNETGIIARVLQTMQLPDGNVKVLIEGLRRAKMNNLVLDEECYFADVEWLLEDEANQEEIDTARFVLIKNFEIYVGQTKRINQEVLQNIIQAEDLSRMTFLIASNLKVKAQDFQSVLEINNPAQRAEKVIELIKTELELLKIDERIKNRVKANEEQDTVYRERVERSVARMEKDEQNGMSPWDIAAAVCKVIEKKNPPTTFTVGAQYKLLRFLKRILPEKFINYILFKMYGK